ncbi:hypothetical protein B0H19DRAFT_1193459 [Mycena capillaripes]|nr:hypothetical protein B0H19DRAFT_1193459 [Mycena capillaripes]
MAPSDPDKLVQYGIAAARALKEVADGQDIPYLETAAGIGLLIMETVDRVRANKSQCIQLIEQIHQTFCVLVNICGGFGVSPSLAMLHSISRFTETLQKIHAYVRAQADLGMFKRIIKMSENASQFAECTTELQAALNSFGLQTRLIASETMAQIHVDAAERHQQLQALVAQMNDGASSHFSDSTSYLRRSSSTLSLIPGSPKIFYGREAELASTIAALTAGTPARVAILGPGGIGKTALALAVVHNPEIVSIFGANRFFIPLNTTYTAADMIGRIAQNFGLDPEGRPQKAVLRHLCGVHAPILLVLDNIEGCWEPPAARPQVENFLSQLTDVPELHLIVTMRGIERPNKTKWTKPFLHPLMPLSVDAARRTFLDITDEVTDDKIMDEVLALTDHLPLAISLIANLASCEGCETVLEKWYSETTSLLSDGPDKLSNLDKSIMVSVSSARMTANPNALRLLGILSLLPDGVTRTDLEEMNLPLPDLARCQSTLMRCALSYLDSDHRFKVLAPIRELVRQRYPLSAVLQRPLREHFYHLANLFKGPQYLSRPLVHRLSSDLGNLRAVVLYSLRSDDREQLIQTFRCIIKLAGFTYLTTLGSLDGMDALNDVLKTLGEPQLQGEYLFIMAFFDHKVKLETYSKLAFECFEEAGDLAGQAKAYRALGFYYVGKRDTAKSVETLSTALALARKAGDLGEEAAIHNLFAQQCNFLGDTAAALRHARDAQMAARVYGSLWNEVTAMRIRASICERIGDYARSARLCSDAKAILSALALDFGNRVSVFRHIVNTEAEISLQQTNYALARSINASLTTPEDSQTGFSHQEISEGYALVNIAFIDIATGKHFAAGKTLDSARSLFSAHSNKFGLVACDITLGDLRCKEGDYAEARRLYLQSLVALPIAELQTMCVEKLSDVALVQHEVEWAQRYATLLLVLACKSGYQAKMHHALRRLGDVFLVHGDETNALLLFEVALAGFTLMDVHRAKGECLFRIGDIQASRGEASAARISWEAARPEFEKSMQQEDVAECNKRLGIAS